MISHEIDSWHPISKKNLRPSYSELASHLEALVQHAPAELDANDEARIRLIEAANKAIVELETPAEATQRVIYTVSTLV